MGWSFKSSTTNSSKLPNDWKEQGTKLVQRLAYLVKAHDIPPKLVVNMDQATLSLVQCAGERTYARKGAREISVMGRDDKRPITLVPSLTAASQMLPMQVIFEGKIKNVLLQSPIVVSVRHKGWLLMYTTNRWSNLKTTKEWVNNILRPWFKKVYMQKGLSSGR